MLCKYGIAEEQSDIRAHVSFPGQQITVFKTADMLSLVETKTFSERTAGQPGVDGITARGFIVPIVAIEPKYILTSSRFPWLDYDHASMDLAERGKAAVAAVRAAIRANRFPLWVCGIVNDDRELDIQGMDILVNAKRRIQVKYDWGAYPKDRGGTGNLFIQTAERNPLGIH